MPQWSRPRRSRNSRRQGRGGKDGGGRLNGAGPDGAGTAQDLHVLRDPHERASMEPAPTEPEQVDTQAIERWCMDMPQWSRPRRSRNSLTCCSNVTLPWNRLNGAGPDGAGTGGPRADPAGSTPGASMEPAPTEPEQQAS